MPPRKRKEPIELARARGSTPEADMAKASAALELRLAGARWEQIAQQVGYPNRGSAYKAVMRLMDRVESEQAGEYRDLDGARLERLLRAVWPAALRGEVRAVTEARRLIEAHVRLYGLAAPIQVQVGRSSPLDDEIMQLAEQLGMMPKPGDANAQKAIAPAVDVTAADGPPAGS